MKFFPSRPLPLNDGGLGAPRPYLGEPLVELTCDAGRLWMPESDGVMRPYIAERGTWEPEEGELLGEFFRPGLRFLDVGANVGYFSLLVASRCPGAVIHAFEPHPLTSQFLALNAWGAGPEANINVHPLALSAGERLLGLTTADHNLGDTRAGAVNKASMLSPAAALDDVLPDAVFDLVKIDVQGFELEAIIGMEGMLRRSPHVVIVAEFWPHALRERGQDPLQVLEQYAALGLHMRVQVGREVNALAPIEVVRVCDGAGVNGQVNLVLTPRPAGDLRGTRRG